MSGNWRDMFENGGNGRNVPPPPIVEDEDHMAPELVTYRPWIIQRGRSRPALLLNLRKFDPRAGLLIGWQASYPHLVGADYIGERMLSLDFGQRKFVITGTGLNELVRYLQQGSVLAVQEYSAQIWPELPPGPVVTSIDKIEGRPADA